MRFIDFLSSHYLTLDMLYHDYRFSKRQVSLLAKHQHNFDTLLKHGISLSQIKKINPKLLGVSDIENVLRLVTLEQIAGTSTTPPPIPEKVFSYPKLHFTDGIVRSFKVYTYSKLHPVSRISQFFNEPFNIKSTTNLCEVEYRNNKGDIVKMSLNTYTPTVEEKSLLDEEIKNIIPERLIHDWYHLSESHSDSTVEINKKIYSPECNFVINKKISLEFPEKRFNDAVPQPFGINPAYHQEQNFTHFLMKKGYPLEAYRQLPGMTTIKLLTLCTHFDFLIFLLEKGMVLTDFVDIDENSLLYVFDNQYAEITALKFVDPHELFGLRQKKLNSSSVIFFSQAPSERNKIDCCTSEYSHAASSTPE
ncbi:hypothetical protein [Legionella worsleiensis]|nr:hypothetical protein [Legionella worsleiensis]